MKAIDVIESAKHYFLLPIEHRDTGVKPINIGNRIQLEFALQDVDQDKIVATSGDNSGRRCIVLVDLTTEECIRLSQKGNERIMKIKAKN